MLKKIVKYDFLWIEKYMGYYYAACVILALLANFTNDKPDVSTAWLVVDKIVSNTFLSALFSTFLTTFIRCAVKFKNSLYKSESYLTHTLPVERGTVFDGKALAGICSMLLAMLIIAVTALISLADKSFFEQVKLFFGDRKNVPLSALIVLTVIFEAVCMLVCVYFGVVTGNRKNGKRVFFSVLFALIAYAAVQLCVVGSMFICGIFDKDISSFLTEITDLADPAAGDVFRKVFYIVCPLYLAADAIIYLLARRTLKKGVDAE